MTNADTRPTLLTYLLLCLATVVPFLWVVAPYVLPFGMGALLAVITRPIHDRLARRLPAWLSALVVTLGLVVLVMGPITVFLVTVFNEAVEAARRLADDGIGFEGLLDRLVEWGPLRGIISDPAELRTRIQEGAVSIAGAASEATLSVVGQTPEYALDATLCTITVYFMLLDGPSFYDWVGRKLPLPDSLREHLAASFRTSASAVVLSSMAAAGAQTVVVWVAFLALGTPLPFLAAFATFIAAWLPLFGVAPIVAIGAGWHWANDEHWQAIVMLSAGAVAGIVDNVVRPWVLKGRDEMHPLLSLVAIFGGLAMVGMLGVFVGPVLAAMAVAVLRTWPAVARHCDIPVAENEALPEVDLPPPQETSGPPTASPVQ
ncbi:MAG: AI-2E family transporter [Myxococcota bacterium]